MSDKYLDEIGTMEEKLDGFKRINSDQKSEIFDLCREQSDLTAQVDNLHAEIERNDAAAADMTLVDTESYENMVTHFKLVGSHYEPYYD